MVKKISGFTLAGAIALSTMFSGYAEITGSGFRSAACSGMLHINIWLDSNSDGIQDRMEPVYAKARLDLSMTDYQDLGIEMFATDQAGHLEIDSLCKGTYTIQIDSSTIPGTAVFDGVFETGEVIIDADMNPEITINLDGGNDDYSPGERYIDIAYRPVIRGMK